MAECMKNCKYCSYFGSSGIAEDQEFCNDKNNLNECLNLIKGWLKKDNLKKT